MACDANGDLGAAGPGQPRPAGDAPTGPCDADVLIVIPARFGSRRFPGKPLAPVAGRTLLSRVVSVGRAVQSLRPAIRLVVATDHPAIAEHAATLNVPVTMTAIDLASGTARALTAARDQPRRPEVVVNLQGDAPFVEVATIMRVIDEALRGLWPVVTPVTRLDWDELDAFRAHKLGAPFSGTTCVRHADGRAIWFSKTILPAIRDEARRRAEGDRCPVFRHLGLYAYSIEGLQWFEQAPAGTYEAVEELEQLRFLEAGRQIMTVEATTPRISMSGIDTPQDVQLAERLIAAVGDPHA